MTDRFSSKSFIFLEEKEISKNISKEEITDILKIGRIIVTTIHEINHNIIFPFTIIFITFKFSSFQ